MWYQPATSGAGHGRPLPLDQARQEQKKSTLNNMRWAIDTIHQQQGLTDPTNDPEAKQQIKGLFRTMAEQLPEQVTLRKKKPITIKQIRIMNFPKGVLGLRDEALLLLGFATVMRRSELVVCIPSRQFCLGTGIWNGSSR